MQSQCGMPMMSKKDRHYKNFKKSITSDICQYSLHFIGERDDKIIIIPNHMFISETIYNYTQNHLLRNSLYSNLLLKVSHFH